MLSAVVLKLLSRDQMDGREYHRQQSRRRRTHGTRALFGLYGSGDDVVGLRETIVRYVRECGAETLVL